MDEFIARVPKPAETGCYVPIRIRDLVPRSWSSQTVYIAVSEAETCIDRPPVIGLLQWKIRMPAGGLPPKTVVEFTAEFPTGGGVRPPELFFHHPMFFDGFGDPTAWRWVRIWPGSEPPGLCSDPNPWRYLDAGVLRVSGPSFGPFEIQPQHGALGVHYRAQWEVEEFQPGTYVVQGTGGADIGPFSSSVRIPEAIVPDVDYPPGAPVRDYEPLAIRWHGGNSVSQVKALIAAQDITGRLSPRGFTIVPAPFGDATLRGRCASEGPCPWSPDFQPHIGIFDLFLWQRPLGEFVVQRFPLALRDQQAVGKNFQGWHLWEYEWHWRSLRVSYGP